MGKIKDNLIKIVVFIGLMFVFIVVGSTINKDDETENVVKQVESDKKTPKDKEKKTEVKNETKKETATDKDSTTNSKIDTSGFIYAESVEVTDAISINKHINLVVHMNPETVPGLATQHVFRQTYDFLQQSEVKKAKTVTIGVMQEDTRIAQITVNVAEFVAGENFIDSVLKVSKIEKMIPEVQQYGTNMELW